MVILWGALWACGSPEEPKIVDGGVILEDGGIGPLVEVGTGTDAFVPLQDADAIPIIAGPQGGYHLWTSVRVFAPMDPRDILVDVGVVKDGVVLEPAQYRLNLVKKGDRYEYYAMTALIPEPAAVRGQEVLLRVEVKDAQGRTATDARKVVPHGP